MSLTIVPLTRLPREEAAIEDNELIQELIVREAQKSELQKKIILLDRRIVVITSELVVKRIIRHQEAVKERPEKIKREDVGWMETTRRRRQGISREDDDDDDRPSWTPPLPINTPTHTPTPTRVQRDDVVGPAETIIRRPWISREDGDVRCGKGEDDIQQQTRDRQTRQRGTTMKLDGWRREGADMESPEKAQMEPVEPTRSRQGSSEKTQRRGYVVGDNDCGGDINDPPTFSTMPPMVMVSPTWNRRRPLPTVDRS